MIRNLLAVVFLSTLVLMTSCIKKENLGDKNVENFNPVYRVPIGSGELTIGDMLDQFQVDSLGVFQLKVQDGLYTMCFTDSAEGSAPEEYYKLDDLSVDQSFGVGRDGLPEEFQLLYDLPFGGVLLVNPLPFTFDTIINYSFDELPLDIDNAIIQDAEIKYVILEKGKFMVEVSSDYESNVDLKLDVLSLTKGADTLSFDFNNVQSSTQNKETDLAKYKMNLEDADKNTNTLSMRVTATVDGDISDKVVKDDKIHVKVSVEGLQYELVVGYMGTFEIPLESGNSSFGSFGNLGIEQIENAKIKLNDPKIKLDYKSSVGIPALLTINDIEFFSDDQSKGSIKIQNDTWPIDYQKDFRKYKELIPSETQVLDKNNAVGLDDFFNILPDSARYNIDLHVTGQKGQQYFLHHESKVVGQFTAEIPLGGSIENFVQRDTLKNEISKEDATIDLLDHLQEVELKVVLENELPLEVDVQIYFADSNGVIIDSVFEDGKRLMESCIVKDEFCVERNTTITYIPLDHEKYNNVVNAATQIMEVIVNTTNQGSEIIRFQSTDAVKVKLGLKLSLDVDLKALLDNVEEDQE